MAEPLRLPTDALADGDAPRLPVMEGVPLTLWGTMLGDRLLLGPPGAVLPEGEAGAAADAVPLTLPPAEAESDGVALAVPVADPVDVEVAGMLGVTLPVPLTVGVLLAAAPRESDAVPVAVALRVAVADDVGDAVPEGVAVDVAVAVAVPVREGVPVDVPDVVAVLLPVPATSVADAVAVAVPEAVPVAEPVAVPLPDATGTRELVALLVAVDETVAGGTEPVADGDASTTDPVTLETGTNSAGHPAKPHHACPPAGIMPFVVRSTDGKDASGADSTGPLTAAPRPMAEPAAAADRLVVGRKAYRGALAFTAADTDHSPRDRSNHRYCRPTVPGRLHTAAVSPLALLRAVRGASRTKDDENTAELNTPAPGAVTDAASTDRVMEDGGLHEPSEPAVKPNGHAQADPPATLT